MYYLVQYDRSGGKLIDIVEYDDADQKRLDDTRLTTELEHLRANREVEVVVLQAPDLLALRQTHRRYFETIQSIASHKDP